MTDHGKALEAAARAACIEGGFNPDEIMPNDGPRWRYYVPTSQTAITAYLAQREADGAVMVPVEPTEAMAVAGWDALCDDDEPEQMWRAMLAARPKFDPPAST